MVNLFRVEHKLPPKNTGRDRRNRKQHCRQKSYNERYIEGDIENRLRNMLEDYVTLGVTPQGEPVNIAREQPRRKNTKNRPPKDGNNPREVTLREEEQRIDTQTSSRGNHQEAFRVGTLGRSWVEQVDAEREEENQHTQDNYQAQDAQQEEHRNYGRSQYSYPEWNEKKETDKFVAKHLNKLAPTEEVSARPKS